VRLVVDNPQLRLRPGQYGDVVFDLPAASALVVPRDAVIDTGQQQYVYVDRGEGRFEPRLVRVGSLFGEDRQVLDGLREGERVVTRGNFMLDAESRLQAALSEVPVTP
jgi:Cu(I)/Ag(I) efflux system membrane fusion protein